MRKSDNLTGQQARERDRDLIQRIPSGIEAKASLKIRMYGCNLYLFSKSSIENAWQKWASMYEGYSSYYIRLTRLFQELDIGRADGRYAKMMRQFAKADVLIMDEWGLSSLTDQHRRDLLEILDDRYKLRATIIASQLPVSNWHEAIGDPTLADAILDRVVHNAYKINLSGKTMRKEMEKLTTYTTKP